MSLSLCVSIFSSFEMRKRREKDFYKGLYVRFFTTDFGSGCRVFGTGALIKFGAHCRDIFGR